MRYFVCAIRVPDHAPIPIMAGTGTDDEELALYSTREEALAMAREQPLCRFGGCKVIPWDL